MNFCELDVDNQIKDLSAIYFIENQSFKNYYHGHSWLRWQACLVKIGLADPVYCFVSSQDELKRLLPELIKEIAESGCSWISWYKKPAGIPTDITEDRIRDIVLPTGWVDIKVFDVNEQWSVLKMRCGKK